MQARVQARVCATPTASQGLLRPLPTGSCERNHVRLPLQVRRGERVMANSPFTHSHSFYGVPQASWRDAAAHETTGADGGPLLLQVSDECVGGEGRGGEGRQRARRGRGTRGPIETPCLPCRVWALVRQARWEHRLVSAQQQQHMGEGVGGTPCSASGHQSAAHALYALHAQATARHQAPRTRRPPEEFKVRLLDVKDAWEANMEESVGGC